MPRFSDVAVARHRERQREVMADKYRNGGRQKRLESRRFIGWDGEGYRAFAAGSGSIDVEHRYMLFGNSEGYAETGLNLTTRQCLDLILFTEQAFPDAFHVGFAFEYDVNMILGDLPWMHLAVLNDAGKVFWNNYRIEHIPHKVFRVSRKGVSATIYDVFGFFHSSYVKAIERYKCGTEEIRQKIADGKKKRSSFTYADIDMVERYWADEISLLPELMECVRESLYTASFFVTQWHGPGAVATFALRETKSLECKSVESEVPVAVRVARSLAYAGGRFQSWRGGMYLGPVYTADINSAYAYAIARLPNLSTGHWERRNPKSIKSRRDIAHFGLYRVRYQTSERRAQEAAFRGIPFPLFHRDKSGHLTWPHETEVWVWSPEAACIAGNPDAVIVEAWEFKDDGTRPFEWVYGMYDRRVSLPPGHPARDAYKWCLASIYGSFARRVGWDRARRIAPRTHQLEWAGYITSYCRSMVWDGGIHVARRDGMVSIDTDGITSLVPFDPAKLMNGEGTALGQWKLSEYTGILHWQNGFYWLRNEKGEWVEPKTRGVPKGSLSVDRALDAIERSHGLTQLDEAVISFNRQRFVGYKQGLRGRFGEWRHWVTEPVDVRFGGAGKGTHIPRMCLLCQGSDVPMHTITNIPPVDILSHAHKLPWLEPVTRQEYGEKLIFPDELVGEYG